ncbi:MAG: hypothetical protein NW206_11700 [Hyphomonadaceae bacterium]|nr:hypothetical protein [Hyphomonadaceae bacterium]
MLGLASLAIVLAFQQLPEVQAAYAAGAFPAEMSRFQRASTLADLAGVFGDPADPAKLAAMRAANSLDLYIFIPAYTLFLFTGAAMVAGGLRAPLAWLSILPALIGAGADVVETSRQIAISADYANAASHLPLAPWCWTKYFALAFAGAGVTAICWLGPKKRWVLGAASLVPLLATSAFAFGVIALPAVMTMSNGVFWIALIVIGVVELVRKPA